jgi:long-chain acyl-CoA synthetase
MRFENLDEAAALGMSLAHQAAAHPERTALLSPHGERTFARLNENANRVARRLREAGVRCGDGVALLSPNRPEFAEVFFACQRLGVRLTPINWHLTADEVAYIVADSGAVALFADAALATAAGSAAQQSRRLRLACSVGGDIDGFEPLESALAALSGGDIDDPQLGDTMLYTSGTTGRPKGVRRAMPEPRKAVEGMKLLSAVFGFDGDGDDTALATGPLYHSGPIHLCLSIPINAGIPTILMDRWRPEEMLRLIAAHGVTHTYCVPTMFSRLLALPEATRRAYDVSSLRFVIHGAAPCRVEDKRAIIEWFGPIVTEIYAATEGMGTLVTSQEWLAKPGTVGRPTPDAVRILDERGAPVAAGAVGTVFLRPMAGGEFEYWRAAEKTRDAMRDGYFTVGDMGYVDADGYLFLSGRSAEVIISGGSNVYPAEIDDVLLSHPSVADAAAYGAADADWGEVVHAAIVPAPGTEPSDALAAALLAHYAGVLPTYKRPRAIRFLAEIPRSEAGKIYRSKLRDQYGRSEE